VTPAARRAGPVVSFLRVAGRYAIATAMIPVGVALGVGGLIQFALRTRRQKRALDDGGSRGAGD
jgi:hypothetical protein